MWLQIHSGEPDKNYKLWPLCAQTASYWQGYCFADSVLVSPNWNQWKTMGMQHLLRGMWSWSKVTIKLHVKCYIGTIKVCRRKRLSRCKILQWETNDCIRPTGFVPPFFVWFVVIFVFFNYLLDREKGIQPVLQQHQGHSHSLFLFSY